MLIHLPKPTVLLSYLIASSHISAVANAFSTPPLRRSRSSLSTVVFTASAAALFQVGTSNKIPLIVAATNTDESSSCTSTSNMENGNISEASGDAAYSNVSRSGEIATFDGDEKAKATDFANYFSAYAQLYHQKQMLTDHNRMAAYHAAIVGNSEIFKDKVVMDVGTGSGILAVWAAQAGAKRVYAVEYTDMANHARSVMEANGVADIVTVIQGAVEEIDLPADDIERFGLSLEDGGDPALAGIPKDERVVDIIISEWMGYFLLRESMLDSLVRARDRFMKPNTGLMFPSHATMLVAPISDEEDRRAQSNEYAGAMSDWHEFAETTRTVYGVDMSVLESEFDREQREYYVLSSRWAELPPSSIVADPQVVKTLDMHTCTVDDSRGISVGDVGSTFDFDVTADEQAFSRGSGKSAAGAGTISGFAGWFTVDFKSRTDEAGATAAPTVPNPAHLSTGPEMGYTHWGQQVFHFPSAIPLIPNQTTRLNGTLEMMRSKESARLYNVRYNYMSSRRKTGADKDDDVLMQNKPVELVYQIP